MVRRDDEMDRWRTILAIDPGGTTGWVTVLYDQEVEEVQLLRWGTFSSLKDEMAASGLMYYIDGASPDHVVAESYVIRPDTAMANIGLDLEAVEVLGRIELWIKTLGVAGPLHRQTASQAKQQWGNRRLKAHFPNHDLRPAGSPQAAASRPGRLCKHQCDALRHAMTFIENHFGVQLVSTRPEDLI